MKKTLVFVLLVSGAAGLLPSPAANDLRTEAARYSDLASEALERGKGAKARELFERALKLDSELPAAQRGLGDLAMKRGDFSAAVVRYEAARDGYPDRREVPGAAYYRLGQALLEAGSLVEATAAFELAVAADPGLAEAQHQLALAYWKMGLAVEAARSLERAAELGIEVDPELATRIAREAGDRTNRRPSSSYIDAEHQRFQARVAQLFGSEDPLSALDALDEFLAARPDDVGALALRGDVLARLGHYGPSEADLLRVLELWPGSFDAHYQLAALHRTTGHPLQALAWLRSAIEHVADSEQRAKILLNIAELERETGNLGGAIAAFSQAVVSDPSLERLVNPELADLHTQSDQPD